MVSKLGGDFDGGVTLYNRTATCDFCQERTKKCVNNNGGIDMCWDCINQLFLLGKKNNNE